MKIYFDGCSWTWGSELKDPYQSRYSKIVSDKLGAEEYNISKPGASNSRMVRRLLVDHKDLSEFDLIVIQMTYPQRMEYYDKDMRKFVQNRNWSQTAKLSINQLREVRWCKDQRKLLLNNAVLDNKDKAWLDYYRYIYEDEYGDTYDDMYATAIRSYCKANSVPLILATTKKKKHSKLSYDVYCGDVPRASGGHPNEEGHSIQAQQILELI
tara:strand:+ start:1459 stop:2091 length:633 start_codon:yes stop_codon:yes gene_type:complete